MNTPKHSCLKCKGSLSQSIINHHNDCLVLIIPHVHLKEFNSAALRDAIDHDNYEAAKLLMIEDDIEGNSLSLISATSQCKIDFVKLLLPFSNPKTHFHLPLRNSLDFNCNDCISEILNNVDYTMEELELVIKHLKLNQDGSFFNATLSSHIEKMKLNESIGHQSNSVVKKNSI